jgi:hypothetical protein
MAGKNLLGGGLEALLSGVQESHEPPQEESLIEPEAKPPEPIQGEITKDLSRWQFTAHQHSILAFIKELSGDKGYAIIPKKKHFELCGVDKYRITIELKRLQDGNVIEWREHTNYFRIRYESQSSWKVAVASGFDPDVLVELQNINKVSDGAT